MLEGSPALPISPEVDILIDTVVSAATGLSNTQQALPISQGLPQVAVAPSPPAPPPLFHEHVKWLAPMEMCFNGSVVMGEIIVERSAGTLVEQLPAGQSILLTPRRPLGKKLEWKKYFQHFWTSPQERDTWWWHHIHMELGPLSVGPGVASHAAPTASCKPALMLLPMRSWKSCTCRLMFMQ